MYSYAGAETDPRYIQNQLLCTTEGMVRGALPTVHLIASSPIPCIFLSRLGNTVGIWGSLREALSGILFRFIPDV